MNDVVKPGAGLIFMKVGTHAREPLDEIIARKRREIEDAGFSFWGYGGGTCHPLTMVQPFAQAFVKRGGAIYLCMQPMNSQHFALPTRAREYSTDGSEWQEIPAAVNVKGSRYALVLGELREDEFDLPLAQTRVAIGNSQGRAGDRYVTGHVDKACLEVVPDVIAPDAAAHPGGPVAKIGLVAKLVEPYAVLVRS